MTRVSKIAAAPPYAVEAALKRLGRNIRRARLRRSLRLEDLAEKVGVTRFVLSDVERGKPTTGIAAYIGALWALGLVDDLQDVADPDRDEEGKALEALRGPKTAPKRQALDNDF